MILTCERPWVFWGILLLIPSLLLFVVWYRRIMKAKLGAAGLLSRLKLALPLRCGCWACAWILLLAALSGLSWGSQLVPVPQTGSSLSLVFDISWSMMAQDVGYDKNRFFSRLEAAASYGEALLEHLDSTDVSVVIAKGEGVVAIPLTRDFNAVRALLPALSPRLITTTGSSLGSGLQKAASSFPVLSVAKKTVVVLTDGEETDGTLEAETRRLAAAGIDVIFLGFGSVAGTDIMAGDGRTVVHSSLQEERLAALVDSVEQSLAAEGRRSGGKVLYLPAQSLGSAHKVLATVTGGGLMAKEKNAAGGEEATQWTGTAYQLEQKPRWQVFANVAMVFLLAGFVVGELNGAFFKKLLRHLGGGRNLVVVLVAVGSLLLQGCSVQWKGAAGVLEGAFFWHQGKYQRAISGFMEAMDIASASSQEELLQYSTYGLATTYIMQGETEAALNRLQELAPDAPSSLTFSALYNTGVISYNQGKYQEAATLFRKALEIDSANLDAKINLELSLGQNTRQSSASSQEVIPVQEKSADDIAESTLFSLIREQEQDRWKNQQDQEQTPSGDDY
ncbi:MAG: VWA domain-containing protein [Treponema sp.]|nr:VWA domain-containing protein [Treponema sp.]